MPMLTSAAVIVAGAGAAVLLGVRALGGGRAPDDPGSQEPSRPQGLGLLSERLDTVERRFAALPSAESEAELEGALVEGRAGPGTGRPRPDRRPGADVPGPDQPLTTALAGGSPYWSLSRSSRTAASRLDPPSRAALDAVGERFQDYLLAAGLPLYRFTVWVPSDPGTPPLPVRVQQRSGAAPAAVRMEIQYREFDYLPRPDEALVPGSPASRSDQELETVRVSAFREIGRRHWTVLAVLLANALGELRDEDRIRVELVPGRPVFVLASARPGGATAAAG